VKPYHAHIERAFTLVELLIVIAIISALSGMGMTILTTASAAAKRSASTATMSKLDTALHLFKADFMVYPYQATYPNDDQGWTNRLAYTVGSMISDEDRENVLADMDDAAAQYNFPLNSNAQPLAPVSAHAFRLADVVTEGGSTTAGAITLNRMAQERVRLMILSGDARAKGVKIRGGRDLSHQDVLAAPRSEARPGWANDYLGGEIARRFISGEQVLDGWGRPIVYIGRIAPSMRPSTVYLFRQFAFITDPGYYGLGDSGRRSLAANNPMTGEALTADGDLLPDPEFPRHSDVRYYAAPGYETEFELWSAGRDGRFAAMRDALVNSDNIGYLPYNKDL
jgi:prepilin-type N-terminal cleavage/methylation domain-containing protein